MSTRHVISTALLATALAAGSASAQFPVHFGLAAGASVPTADLANGQKTGYHGMAVLDFSMPLSPIGVRIDGAYNKFGGKAIAAGNPTQDFRLINVTGDVVLAVPGMILAHPYAIAGVGYYNGKSTGGPTTEASRSKFGYNGGLGVKLGLSGFATFIEARYHYVPSFVAQGGTALSYVPITFGIMF